MNSQTRIKKTMNQSLIYTPCEYFRANFNEKKIYIKKYHLITQIIRKEKKTI